MNRIMINRKFFIISVLYVINEKEYTIFLLNCILFLYIMKVLSLLVFMLVWYTSSANALGHGTSLFFIENKGQVHDQHYNTRGDIDLKIIQGNTALFIGNGHLHYQFARVEGKQTHTWRMDVELIGANKHALLELAEQQQYYERYFTTATGSKGVVAHTYNRAVYKNIYPGIDWVFYIKDGIVKHEFIVEEGVDASLIRIKYAGSTGLRINTDGSMTAETPLGAVTEARPYCFTADKKEVSSAYRWDDSILTFQLGAYSGRLTIDPSLDWGTYLHASTNQPYVMALDIGLYGAGQVYTCGYTAITDLATVGAHQFMFGGVGDGFLAKFDSAGNRLWATYYGGADFEVANGLKCDAPGNIYVCGNTASANAISTPGSFQDVFGGGDDGFLVKFDSTGDRVWATYFGGSSTDGLEYISIDSAANLYVSGGSLSSGLSTSGAYQSVNAGQGDVDLGQIRQCGQPYMGHVLRRCSRRPSLC